MAKATPTVAETAPVESTANESNGDSARRLSDADLAKLIDILKGVDSTELKVTVPSGAHRTSMSGLPLDPVEAQPRQVFFFDTPDLALNKAGVVVRARRIQGGKGDTVVKLRPVQPDQLPADLRRAQGFNVEVDVIPGGFVCSASYKGKASGQDVRDALGGDLPLRKLFSKTQRAFYAEHAPKGLALEDLSVLGPTFVLKAAFEPKELGRRMVAEMWLYPDGSRLLELSTKCAPTEAFQVATEARAYLHARGVEIGGAQETKTKVALGYFAGQLKAEAGADPKS